MESDRVRPKQDNSTPDVGDRKERARVSTLSARALTLNDAHSPALRLNHDIRPSRTSLPHSFQTKLTINEPGDRYEQEADRVAEQVMRMPDAAIRLQRSAATSTSHQAQRDPGLNSVSEVLQSSGQPLDSSTRAFMESRFNHDFSSVRVHTGSPAAKSARAVNARAYTVGQDVVFGAGQYSVGTFEGKRLLAHELTHVAQQGSENVVRRDPPPPGESGNITRLRQLLQDDNEDAAIVLMGRLNVAEVQQVFASRELKELAIGSFDDHEMYRGVRALHGDLYPSLEWMFDEGTNWAMVREVLIHAPSGKERVRADTWMKARFVEICDDNTMAHAVDLLGGTLLQKLTWMMAEDSNWSLVQAKIRTTTDPNEKLALYDSIAMRHFFTVVCDDNEMAEAVSLLGGTLLQQLRWMRAEGSNWSLVRARIQATADPAQKTALYAQNDMRDFFVDVCNDNTMAQAVDLLGGTLLQKLTWMKAEDSNWSLVRARIVATANANEKLALYVSTAMRDFFVDICNDREMTEAVLLLGGTLLQKINWLLAEEASAEFFYSVIRVAPAAELPVVTADAAHMNALRSHLSRGEFERVTQMLTQGLLHWEERSSSYEEQHYEQASPTSPWRLESFTGHTGYEIRYTRSELRVIVRIRLTGVTAPQALQTTWITGIQNRWNNQFHIENSRHLAVVFDPIFTSTNHQHSVEVHNVPASGSTREDETNFYTNTTGDTAAHEFGHMVGLEDEYRLTATDFQRLSGTAPPTGPVPAQGYTIPGLMTAGTGPVQGRHLAPFLQWLNSHRLAGERPYRLVAGP